MIKKTRFIYDEELEDLIEDILKLIKDRCKNSKSFTITLSDSKTNPKADIVFDNSLSKTQVDHIFNAVDLLKDLYINRSIIKNGNSILSITMEVSVNERLSDSNRRT